MAQTNYTPISLYYSTTASQAPSAGNLVSGELAINITDGKLYYKDNSGVVQIIAGKGGAGVAAGSNTQVQFNNSGAFGASSSFTWDGTTLAATKFSGALNGTVGATTTSTGAFTTLDASGNVTLSGGTANGVLYLNGSKVATSGAALTFDGTTLTTANGTFTAQLTTKTLTSGVSAAFMLPWIGDTTAGGSGAFYTTTGLTFNPSTGTLSVPSMVNSASALLFGIGASEKMRLDSSGNLGLGVVPESSWNTNWSAMAIGRAGNYIAAQKTGPNVDLISNAKFGSGSDVYSNNGTAGYLSLSGNAFNVYQAASGTAGNAITWTNALALDSSGNLGLGVTPSAWGSGYKAIEIGNAGLSGVTATTYLTQNAYINSSSQYVYKSSALASVYYQNSGEHVWQTAASGTAGNTISFTQAMTLNASGNLGVGVTSITAIGSSRLLEIGATTGNSSFLLFNVNGSRTGAVYSNASETSIGSISSTPLLFKTVDTERARITSAGYFKASDNGTYNGATLTYHEFYNSADNAVLLLRAANSTQGSDVFVAIADRNTTNNSFYAINYYNSGASAYKFRVADSGNVTNTNNSYGAISDIKLKENVTDATPKLDKLNQVRVVNYNFINNQQKQLGVIAQELEQIFPGMVEESPDRDQEGNDLGTTTKSVKYSVFVPMLIKAIQELKAEIDNLKTQLKGA